MVQVNPATTYILVLVDLEVFFVIIWVPKMCDFFPFSVC